MEEIQHQQMGYDRAATMFSPNGHILQVEYAEKTIRLGSASIGMISKDGVVIVSDRRQKDELVIEESANKINEIDEYLICVSAGISSDARVLVDKARVLAQQHRVTYDSAPNTEAIVRDIADLKQQFTQYGGGRPFGVSMMFAGVKGGSSLYVTDITGNYLKYRACAIGESDEKIRNLLKEKYSDNLSSDNAISLALNIFKKIHGEKFNIGRFDVVVLSKEGIRKFGKEELKGIKLD
jgi:proteasome alpha subunit